MIINSDIQDIINFLQEKQKQGYEKVELIDDAREKGWFCLNPKIEFVFNKNEPKILGIDIRTKK